MKIKKKVVYVAQAKYRQGSWVDAFTSSLGLSEVLRAYRNHVRVHKKKRTEFRLLKRKIEETDITP